MTADYLQMQGTRWVFGGVLPSGRPPLAKAGGGGVRLTDVWHRFPISPSVLRIPRSMGLSFHVCLAMSPDVSHNPELERG